MKASIQRFIDRINAHDVDGILDCMADEYTFVNSSGDRFTGRDFMRQTWSKQFNMIPDFRIRVQQIIADDEGVAVFGLSEGTPVIDGDVSYENRFSVPAAFLGKANENGVTFWETYADASIIYDLVHGGRQKSGTRAVSDAG